MTQPRLDTATVFITNMSPAHSYESIPKYGAPRPVTTGNYPIWKTERLQEEIVRALSYSQPTDYLAFSGSSFVAAICLAVWLFMHKECRALLYDPKQKSYVPRTLKKLDIVTQIEKVKDTQR